MDVDDKILKMAVDAAGDVAAVCSDKIRDDPRSPIEKLLAAAFNIRGEIASMRFTTNTFSCFQCFSGDDVRNTIECVINATSSELSGKVNIFAQVRVGAYTADFIAGMNVNGQCKLICVECDGHEFHEKTKEQAAHDKARDRFFVSLSIPVMRFTGSEIWKDPLRCADQVLDYFHMLHIEWHNAARNRGSRSGQQI